MKRMLPCFLPSNSWGYALFFATSQFHSHHHFCDTLFLFSTKDTNIDNHTVMKPRRSRPITTKRAMLLVFAVSLTLVSKVSAFSEAPLSPWGFFGSKLSSTRKKHKNSISTKSVEAKSATKSGIGYSIKSKVQLGADANKCTSHNDGDGDYPLRIIIMGGPASGKGTQCEKIAQRYGVIHLSTGDLLREAVRQGTRIGLVAKSFMDAGELVPDEIMIQIVTERISQSDCRKHGYLLDGFPRTPAQAEALSSMGISADVFVFLNVPDSELIARVVGRRLDPVTGKIYHMKYLPPPESVLDRLVHRSDDTREKMTNRLQQFHHNVDSVRSYYNHVLVEIDGTGSPDSITERILAEIDSKTGLRSHAGAR